MRSSILIPFLLFPFLSLAQGDLATDRPSESAAATLLPAGFARAEVGGRLDWETVVASGEQTFSYAAPLGVVRYGLSDVLELRVGARFSQQVGAVDDAMVGAKVRLPGDFWGETDACYLVELNVDPARGWSPGQNVPSAHRLCVGTAIGHLWSVTGNAGWMRAAGASTWMGSLAVGRELGVQGWTGFVEPFVYSGAPLRVNAGFQRTLKDGWLADVAMGRNVGGDLAQFQVQIGLALTLTQPTAE